MTIDDVRAIREDFLSLQTVGYVLRMRPDRVRYYLKNGQMPVPYRESGNRITVSREGLINWFEGKPNKPKDTVEDRLKALTEKVDALTAAITALTAAILGSKNPEGAGTADGVNERMML